MHYLLIILLILSGCASSTHQNIQQQTRDTSYKNQCNDGSHRPTSLNQNIQQQNSAIPSKNPGGTRAEYEEYKLEHSLNNNAGQVDSFAKWKRKKADPFQNDRGVAPPYKVADPLWKPK